MRWTLIAEVAAIVVALGVAEVVTRTVMRLSRHSVVLAELASHARRAFQVFLVVLAIRLVIMISPVRFDLRVGLLHTLAIAVLVSGAWLVATVLLALEDAAESRYRIDVPDNRQARRIRTQVVILRRVTIAAIVVVTLGLIMLSFAEVRTLGKGLLASAGILGILTGLAAQSVLGNVIAGLQLAFSEAIRLDDVVVVEREWCRVEEITLSHVVLQVWDGRRLVVPTSYFTTKPYENWTRTRAELLGEVEFDVDWETPVSQMRDELRRAVESNDLWDGRVCVLQVTRAVRGVIRVRALVSAIDAPGLWDLRCGVREHLVAWARDQRPIALPHNRVEAANAGPLEWPWSRRQPLAPTAVRPEAVPPEEEDSRVFSGTPESKARGEAFAGPHDDRPRDRQPDRPF